MLQMAVCRGFYACMKWLNLEVQKAVTSDGRMLHVLSI